MVIDRMKIGRLEIYFIRSTKLGDGLDVYVVWEKHSGGKMV